MTDKLTGRDIADSMTGFDEIAIAQRFGRTAADLAQNDGSMFLRSLIFVAKRREGLSDDEAWNAALGLPMKEAGEFFAQDSEEESGKEETPEPEPEPRPGISLASA